MLYLLRLDILNYEFLIVKVIQKKTKNTENTKKIDYKSEAKVTFFSNPCDECDSSISCEWLAISALMTTVESQSEGIIS